MLRSERFIDVLLEGGVLGGGRAGAACVVIVAAGGGGGGRLIIMAKPPPPVPAEGNEDDERLKVEDKRPAVTLVRMADEDSARPLCSCVVPVEPMLLLLPPRCAGLRLD